MDSGILEVTGGTLSILDDTGDTRMQWDKNNPAEVAKAEARFKELQAKGYTAFKVNKKGDREPGDIIRTFDPDAGRIIMFAQMQGG